MIQAKRETAELLQREGCKVKHPLTGKDIYLKYVGIRPDFRRSALIYDFIEVNP
jgi:hypothetical protein